MKIIFALMLTVFAVNIQAAEKEKGKPKEGNFQTNMDFDSSMIDGKMKAPSGFFLQGRNKQSLSNMVKLRSNFSGKLRDSEAAVKALIK
ncbi:MAG TPA: hypothetical protein VFO10_30085 [Oligoflexus sp.]|uniref:hypothetical protein n=1 Tax=Oligoflexus sp. TaxID=1971216 RepID=UPI002D80E95E|nr:hypothetical protein [Oligoflexus sp.]HET9241554.1 hypothetical protein [Oligoflexus sp.]